MTPDQVTLVQQTFAQVVPVADKAAETFYGRLFDVAPAVKPLFRGDMTEQRHKLMATLAVVVRGLSDLPSFCRPPARWPNVMSLTVPGRSIIPLSAVPCCGRWRRGLAMPGRPTSPPHGPRPTARCRVT